VWHVVVVAKKFPVQGTSQGRPFIFVRCCWGALQAAGAVQSYGVGRWQALRGWGSRVVDMARRPVAAGALLYISCTSALEAPVGGRGAVGVVSARCLPLHHAAAMGGVAGPAP
jgi:hypothetical protein